VAEQLEARGATIVGVLKDALSSNADQRCSGTNETAFLAGAVVHCLLSLNLADPVLYSIMRDEINTHLHAALLACVATAGFAASEVSNSSNAPSASGIPEPAPQGLSLTKEAAPSLGR
jgi:hypothetical protein